jgi:hypothetical protein
VHPIDLGLPGVLPVLNARAVELGITAALASSATPKSNPTLSVGAEKYGKDLLDGQWHEVVIPLKALYAKQAAVAPKKARRPAYFFAAKSWNSQSVGPSLALRILRRHT